GIYANQGQTEAIDKLREFLAGRLIVNGQNKVALLKGRGGTGKTTIIKKVFEYEKIYPYQIIYIAPTHKAAQVLKNAVRTTKVFTLASALGIRLKESTGEFEIDLEARLKGLPISTAKYIVVDEASMISDKLFEELLKLTSNNSKIILMGDNAQLPPIGQNEDSVVFKYTLHELTERMRQVAESPIITISDIVANNIESNQPVRRIIGDKQRETKFDLRKNAGVIFEQDINQMMDMWAADFKANPSGTKIVTFNNQLSNSPESVKNLNKIARSKVFPDAKEDFVPGEIVTAYATFGEDVSENPFIQNGVDYTVLQVTPKDITTIISLSTNKVARSFKIQYKGYLLRLKNNITGEIADVEVPSFEEKEKLKQQQNYYYEIDPATRKKRDAQLAYAIGNSYVDIEYGYAITSHKSQGSTYRNVYVMEDNILGNTQGSNKSVNQSLYVAISRASDKVVIKSNNNPTLPKNIVDVIVSSSSIQSSHLSTQTVKPPAKTTPFGQKTDFYQLHSFLDQPNFGVFLQGENSKIYQSIYHAEPGITREKLKAIYENYVLFLQGEGQTKTISFDTFLSLLDTFQVFKFNDTYIFGQYNEEKQVFISKIISPKNKTELLKEAIPLLNKDFNTIILLPKSIKTSNSSDPFKYELSEEKSEKIAVFSTQDVSKKVFGKTIKQLTAEELQTLTEDITLKNTQTIEKLTKNLELLSKISEKLYILQGVRFRLDYEISENYYSKKMKELGLSDEEIGYLFYWINKLEIKSANTFNEIFAKIQLAELQGGVLKDQLNIVGLADEVLNNKLKEWAAQFGIETKSIDEFRRRTGKDAIAVADTLNKIIYYNSEKADVSTFPEEIAHFYIEMLGDRHPLLNDALSKVEYWSEYSKIYEQYKNVYVNENGLPDIRKIKKEALAKAIAARIVGKAKAKKSAFWRAVDAIIQKIKEIFNRDITKFNIELIADEIANDILTNTNKYLGFGSFKGNQIPSNFVLKTYESTINKNPQLVKIISTISELGGILTGSLAYRKQGTVYRKETETIHDLDFKIPYEAYAEIGIEEFIQRAKEKLGLQRAIRPSNNEYLAWYNDEGTYTTVNYVGGKRVKNWKEEGYYHKGDTTWFDKDGNELNEARLLETGELAFDGVSIDFFFQQEDTSRKIVKTKDNFVYWTLAFLEKLKMGRDKDAFDYRTFIPLPEYRKGPIDERYVYYQVEEETPKEETTQPEDSTNAESKTTDNLQQDVQRETTTQLTEQQPKIEVQVKKPKYYLSDTDSIKTPINLPRVPVQQVDLQINKELIDLIYPILEELNSKGYNTLIVGGSVRDALLNIKPKDIDVEVYGITVDDLIGFLSKYGKVDEVGKSFGVLKFIPYNEKGELVELEEPFDFSVPRRENKVGAGYRGFSVELSTDITIQEAASRRDFTWNSMGYNPITKTLYDYYGGIQDLADGVIRHTSEKFAEDPLRIFRAMQFQARMGHVIAPETYELMRNLVEPKKEKISVNVDVDVKSTFDETINGLEVETTEEHEKQKESLLALSYKYVKKLIEYLKRILFGKKYKFFEEPDAEIVIIAKPLGYELGATKLIERFIRDNGGTIVEQKEIIVDSYRISQHYGEGKANFKNKSFFSDLVEYYTGKKVKVYRVKVNSKAIPEMRALIGHSSRFIEDENSLRKAIVGDRYKQILETQYVLDNGIHMSDSVEEGQREVKIWFGTPQIITSNKEAIKAHTYLWETLQKINPNVQFSGGTLDGTEIQSKPTDLDYRIFSDDLEQTVKEIQRVIPNVKYDRKGIDEKSGLEYHKLEYEFPGGKADIAVVPNHPSYTSKVSTNHLAALMSKRWKLYARREKEYYYQKVVEAEQKYGKDSIERKKAKEDYERIKELLRQQVNEWFSTTKAFKPYDELMRFAQIGKEELDAFLDKLDTSKGLRIKKAPLKSLKSLQLKANTKYHGRLYKAGDIARATIVLDSEGDIKSQIEYIFEELKKEFHQFTVDNYFKYPLAGYKGINISLLTKNDGRVELQINTPEMIFLKETKQDAILYLGIEKYNELVKKYGDIGGLGHILYDEMKLAKEANNMELLAQLQKESEDYYNHQIIPERYKKKTYQGEFDHLVSEEEYNKWSKRKQELVKLEKEGKLTPELREEYEQVVSRIPKDRISAEWIKWAAKGKYHSKIFDFLRQSGLGQKLYPELMELIKTPQDPIFHPEGNVEEHTKQVLAKAQEIAVREKLSPEEKEILILSALFHDIAKPETTKEEWSEKLGRMKITAKGHEPAGEPKSKEIMNRIGIPKKTQDIVGRVIGEHLAHANIASLETEKQKLSAFIKLMNRLQPATFEQLTMLMEADMLGRNNADANTPASIIEFNRLNEENKKLNKGKSFTPMITGKKLLQLGLKPGKQIGEILEAAKEAQLNLEFTNESEAMEWLQNYLTQRANEGKEIKYQTIAGELIEELKGPKTTIEEAVNWIRSVMPDANIELVNDLIDGIAKGSYDTVQDLITLSEKYADKKTAKHEVFHAAWNRLSKEKQEELLNEGSKLFGIPRGKSKRLRKFQKLNREELDEAFSEHILKQYDHDVEYLIEKNKYKPEPVSTFKLSVNLIPFRFRKYTSEWYNIHYDENYLKPFYDDAPLITIENLIDDLIEIDRFLASTLDYESIIESQKEILKRTNPDSSLYSQIDSKIQFYESQLKIAEELKKIKFLIIASLWLQTRRVKEVPNTKYPHLVLKFDGTGFVLVDSDSKKVLGKLISESASVISSKILDSLTRTEEKIGQALYRSVSWGWKYMNGEHLKSDKGFIPQKVNGITMAYAEEAWKRWVEKGIAIDNDDYFQILYQVLKGVEYSGDLAIEEKIAQLMETTSDEYIPKTILGRWIQSIKNFFRNLFKERTKIQRFLRDINQGRIPKRKNNSDVNAIKKQMYALPDERAKIIDKEIPKSGLVLPIGISGSGKSTWINSIPNKTVISLDEIRKELTGDISDQSKNREVVEIAKDRLVEALSKGGLVIFDATNVNTKLRNDLIRELESRLGRPIEIFYKIFPANPELSKIRIRNDISSGKDRANVPDHVIDIQYDQYLKTLKDLKIDVNKIEQEIISSLPEKVTLEINYDPNPNEAYRDIFYTYLEEISRKFNIDLQFEQGDKNLYSQKNNKLALNPKFESTKLKDLPISSIAIPIIDQLIVPKPDISFVRNFDVFEGTTRTDELVALSNILQNLDKYDVAIQNKIKSLIKPYNDFYRTITKESLTGTLIEKAEKSPIYAELVEKVKLQLKIDTDTMRKLDIIKESKCL
ncbi:MAG: AAA family ATPase, partial [Candidatus Dojkabacteria bacterium]|nr:AAA family ATPase [Candidatus Dojkabacteria bacterium]